MTCEACKSRPEAVAEPCDEPGSSFRLCAACHAGLLAHALQPSEWYNLAGRYGGWQFHLHEDFYDDRGNAQQPDVPVANTGRHPVPTLADVCGDASTLFDFTLTRMHLEAPTIEAWRRLHRERVLGVVESRFAHAPDRGIRSIALEIAADVLGTVARSFVESAWRHFPAAVDLDPLARASAACLRRPDGFGRVVTALAELDERERRVQSGTLVHFRSPEALDWIERNVPEQVAGNWGFLASLSNLEWERVIDWIEKERPLSLVALDALVTMVKPPSPFVRACAPRLVGTPQVERLDRSLTKYARKDAVLRVERCVSIILEGIEELVDRPV